MFRLSGKKVELIRHIVSWSESIDGETQSMTEWCVSEKHRDEIITGLNDKKIKCTVEDIDQTANEWIDGLRFDNYDTAKKALDAGETLGKPMARIDVKDKIKALETENTSLKARLEKIENTDTVKSELTKISITNETENTSLKARLEKIENADTVKSELTKISITK